MTQRTIYKTPEGRAEILAAYDRRLAALKLRVESQRLETRFGSTHLLAAGPSSAPPLVLVPGTNGCALDFAEPFGGFASHRRCFFLDVPGEPNPSSETRPSRVDDSLGRWLEDVLDALALPRAAFLGMSGGGYALLKAAAAMPERISRAVLLVPQGLSEPRFLPLLRGVLWPLLRYRLRPGAASARRFVAGISRPAPVADAAVEAMNRVLSHLDVGYEAAPRMTAQQLARLEAPVLLVAGARDVIFPGDRSVRYAREVIPNLREALLLPDANHVSAELVTGKVLERIDAFLREPD